MKHLLIFTATVAALSFAYYSTRPTPVVATYCVTSYELNAMLTSTLDTFTKRADKRAAALADVNELLFKERLSLELHGLDTLIANMRQNQIDFERTLLLNHLQN